jgi:hypothetical protein
MSTHQSMQEPKPIAISFLLDRSGSMENIRHATIIGINDFVEKQKKNGVPTTFSFTLFNADDYGKPVNIEQVFNAIPIAEITPLDDFTPRGTTPLYDAMVETIRWFEQTIAGKDVRPLCVTMSDGLENASLQQSADSVKALITEKIAQGWEFVYLGANQDAYFEAGKMGIARGSTMSYVATDAGVRDVTQSTSVASMYYAEAGTSYQSGTFFSGANAPPDAPADPQPSASGARWSDPVRHTMPPPPPIPEPRKADASGLTWRSKT